MDTHLDGQQLEKEVMDSCDTVLLYCRSCQTRGVEERFKEKSLPEKRSNYNGNQISCGGLTPSNLTRGKYHKVCQQCYRNKGLLIKVNQFEFSASIFIGRYKKQKVIHSWSQLEMTITDCSPKNTSNSTQNNALQSDDDINDTLNKQVMHTVYHPPFDSTAIWLHMSQRSRWIH